MCRLLSKEKAEKSGKARERNERRGEERRGEER